jgi:hypothetical protein
LSRLKIDRESKAKKKTGGNRIPALSSSLFLNRLTEDPSGEVRNPPGPGSMGHADLLLITPVPPPPPHSLTPIHFIPVCWFWSFISRSAATAVFATARSASRFVTRSAARSASRFDFLTFGLVSSYSVSPQAAPFPSPLPAPFPAPFPAYFPAPHPAPLPAPLLAPPTVLLPAPLTVPPLIPLPAPLRAVRTVALLNSL